MFNKKKIEELESKIVKLNNDRYIYEDKFNKLRKAVELLGEMFEKEQEKTNKLSREIDILNRKMECEHPIDRRIVITDSRYTWEIDRVQEYYVEQCAYCGRIIKRFDNKCESLKRKSEIAEIQTKKIKEEYKNCKK